MRDITRIPSWDQVRTAYDEFTVLARRSVLQAATVGAMLQAIKDEVGHGNFGNTLQSELPQLGRSTAVLWMRLAKHQTLLEQHNPSTFNEARALISRHKAGDGRRQRKQVKPVTNAEDQALKHQKPYGRGDQAQESVEVGAKPVEEQAQAATENASAGRDEVESVEVQRTEADEMAQLIAEVGALRESDTNLHDYSARQHEIVRELEEDARNAPPAEPVVYMPTMGQIKRVLAHALETIHTLQQRLAKAEAIIAKERKLQAALVIGTKVDAEGRKELVNRCSNTVFQFPTEALGPIGSALDVVVETYQDQLTEINEESEGSGEVKLPKVDAYRNALTDLAEMIEDQDWKALKAAADAEIDAARMANEEGRFYEPPGSPLP